MATEIRVPTLGESVTEATIGQWFRKQGESIRQDEPIVELETDKVTVEVPAPVSGVLSEVLVRSGETVEVGALLGSIAEGEVDDTTVSGGPEPIGVRPPAGEEKAERERAGAEKAEAPAAKEAKPSGNGGAPASPAAQKLMAEKGLSADDIEGSGKRGQVLKEDVLAALEKAPSAPAPTPPAARAPAAGDDAAR